MNALRKYGSIMSFALVALFAMSSFAPLANAAYTHHDLTMTVILNGEDVATHNTKDNPLVINVDNDIEGVFSIANNGATIHLTDMSLEIYTIQKILFWDMESKVYTHQVDVDNGDEDGDGKEGFDIPAGLNKSDSFTVSVKDIEEYREQLRGQRVRIDVNFTFEDIPDYTVTVYINFV